MKESRPPADAYRSIYAVIRRIPRGRVATYGQIAALAGLPGHARQVGTALRDLPEGASKGAKIPWQRVLNARGEVSQRAGIGFEEGLQRHLLEEEGIVFNARGRVDLDRFGWDP
ncbi:MAG TPA: MGMT family protein [Thermoanaerobaculia bacterium]|nr:MGMT family protein [Thermoanaerobaculia bacterium]